MDLRVVAALLLLLAFALNALIWLALGYAFVGLAFLFAGIAVTVYGMGGSNE